ncbi:MAG: S9 family peptidase [Vicinamibacterales bacterium]|nr:S9 family peptidase [Vicinamibacterales bacterium]
MTDVTGAMGGGLLLAVLAIAGCGGRDENVRRTVAPFGTWTSPLSAVRATAGAIRFDHPVLDGDDLYWVEGRAAEGGRNVIVRHTADGRLLDVTPPGFNARTRVHEYGGAAFTVHRGTVFFSNFTDQILHRHTPGGVPVPLTTPGARYADCSVDATHGRLVCVREDHTAGTGEPSNAIVAIEGALDLAGAVTPSPGVVLASGADFYSDPVVSPDGRRLAWIEWRHPNMPWDGTELWVADLDAAGVPRTRTRIAGGADESIFQPSWSPDGVLYFVSDRTGWWNLYRARDGAIEPLHPMAAEFGKPQWVFSMVTYAFAGPGRLVATYADRGQWKLALVDLESRRFQPVPLAFEPLEGIVADHRAAYFIGASPTMPLSLVRMTFAAAEVEVLRVSSSDRLDPADVSVAEPITFASQGLDVHAFYYPPANARFEAPPGERPPLIVVTHGGPTGATEGIYASDVQYWTTRGFAVVDVNYGGSTGYGRAYRERLNGQWGIVDVADAVSAARHLVAEGLADPARLIIRGGSAGGYTTLAALAFHEVFKAGASYYGISDIEVLAHDTHKFESRYLDSLIGPYPAMRDVYRARSPLYATDGLNCALILFQGLEDKVVPPNQSERMADAVRAKGLPVAYIAFEGEQHGFRRAENIVRALESELYFYGAVFGFTPADTLAPVPIDNLGARPPGLQ